MSVAYVMVLSSCKKLLGSTFSSIPQAAPVMGLFEHGSRFVYFAPLKEVLGLWHLHLASGDGCHELSVGLDFSKVPGELCLSNAEQGGRGQVHERDSPQPPASIHVGRETEDQPAQSPVCTPCGWHCMPCI